MKNEETSFKGEYEALAREIARFCKSFRSQKSNPSFPLLITYASEVCDGAVHVPAGPLEGGGLEFVCVKVFAWSKLQEVEW